MKRRLPPLNAVRAFEAAARHLNFTRAAEELCITQGAISRHVAGLEEHLRVKLFVRRHRHVELTPAGSDYFMILSDAFDRIQDGTDRVSPPGAGHPLRVRSPPTFAMRWLVPRLQNLHKSNPQINVQINTAYGAVDFEAEDVDIAIYSGAAPPPGVVATRLFGERLVPVCNPALPTRRCPLGVPSDLAKHSLLSSLRRPDDWTAWISAVGATDIDIDAAIKFENSSLAYQAAIDKLGVAIAQKAFVSSDIAAGNLVTPFDVEVPMDRAYFLLYPAKATARHAIRHFEQWILTEANQERNG